MAPLRLGRVFAALALVAGLAADDQVVAGATVDR